MKRLLVLARASPRSRFPRPASRRRTKPPSHAQRATLEAYAAATWHSFVMMTNPTTGPPSDNVSAEGVRAKYTSPTNIATYIWAVARRHATCSIIKPRRGARPDRRHAPDARDARALARPVLQLVRPGHGARLTHVAGGRLAGLPVPLDGRQRLARRRPADGRAGGARSCATRRRRSSRRWTSASTTTRTRARCAAATGHRCRRTRLRADRRLGRLRELRDGHRRLGTRATTTARSTPSRGSPCTSGSRSTGPGRRTTSGCSARSRTRATGTGRRCSRRASTGRTRASTSSRGTTPTAG